MILYYRNRCNKSFHKVATWGRALSCRKITPLNSMRCRWLLISAFSICKEGRVLLKMFGCIHDGFSKHFAQGQLTRSANNDYFHHTNRPMATCEIICLFKRSVDSVPFIVGSFIFRNASTFLECVKNWLQGDLNHLNPKNFIHSS